MRSFSLVTMVLLALSVSSCSTIHGWFHCKKCSKSKCAKRWLAKKDKNKDGKVSRKEWMAHKKKKFGMLDANKDGYITADEMKMYRSKKKCSKCRK